MKFELLIEIVADEPAFETGLLLAGPVDPADVRRQLSRWVKAGRLYQLRRGLYVLAPPFQKIKPHPFVLANCLVRGSYISLQAALAHYGLIPDVVPVVTSVTAQRPGRWETPLGIYEFRHVKAAGRSYDSPRLSRRHGAALPVRRLISSCSTTPCGRPAGAGQS